MNRYETTLNRRPLSVFLTLALCVALGAGLTGCGLRGRQPTQPPAPPTTAPIQPVQPTTAPTPATAAPAQPTVPSGAPTDVPPTSVSQPTAAPTMAAQPDTQGDEIEQLLDQLDQQNQKADPLNDVPQ